jgi:hypothetical protein
MKFVTISLVDGPLAGQSRQLDSEAKCCVCDCNKPIQSVQLGNHLYRLDWKLKMGVYQGELRDKTRGS